MNVRVAAAGFLTSVQDVGRFGFRHAGVSIGGALDAHGLRVANALVGNEDNAAGLEATFGTLRLRFDDERRVAWCGGAFSVQIGNDQIRAGHAGWVSANTELTITAPKSGGRAWLAISGGIEVPVVLGSRSTDLRGNFGGHEGRVLRDGDVLALRQERRERAHPVRPSQTAAPWGAPGNWADIQVRYPVLRIVKGAHWDRFTTEAQLSLIHTAFTVTSDSDRMGARLEGPTLERSDSDDLLSEAATPGTIQVPPNGKPILLLNDCQTIGGYPKIAHVITVDLPIAAQLSAGDAVRFHEVSLEEAQLLLRDRERDFARFRVGLSLQSR